MNRLEMHSLLLPAAMILAASTAQATTIDFEGLTRFTSAGTIDIVTFTGSSGAIIWSSDGLFAQSGVNTVGAGQPESFRGSIGLSFATAVSGLSFWCGGDDDFGKQALIDVYAGGTLVDTANLIGDGDFRSTDFQDLSAYFGVTSILIYDVTNAAGLVYDDFTYTTAVPLPAAAPLLAGELMALSIFAPRRRG